MGKKGLRQRRRFISKNAVYLSVFLVFIAMSAALLIIGLSRYSTTGRQPELTNPIQNPLPLGSTESVNVLPELPETITAPQGSNPIEPAVKPTPAVPREPTPVKPKHKGNLVFIFDDAGHNLWQLEPFLALPFPITIAVLPGLPYTRKAAAMTVAAGKELILHQPMEAIGGANPGPGALYLDMPDHDIRLSLRENLAQLPGALGINNHMGSKATADERIMAIVLDEARQAGVYFVDSLTIAESVVHSTASLMNLRTWERTVFLDNTPDRTSIMKYVSEGTKIAEKRGYAIMIGHVWSADLAQTLSDLYPQLVEQGFSLSTISRIMMDGDDDEDFGN